MAKDITGKRYGKLVALNSTGKKKNDCYIWLCQCDCGSYKEVSIAHLNSGLVVDCGCGREERKLKNTIDLTNQRFGKLTALEYEGSVRKSWGMCRIWKCRCDCGNFVLASTAELRSGDKKSCGCLQSELQKERKTKHGMHNKRIYHVWQAMKTRCKNKKDKEYFNYGGRGIKVCDEWQEFIPFMKWAYANGYDENAKPGECTLDRIDNNGNYCPENCRWVSMKEQQNNKRMCRYFTHNGKTQTLTEWAEEVGINPRTLYGRIYTLNWDFEKAISEPSRRENEKKARSKS